MVRQKILVLMLVLSSFFIMVGNGWSQVVGRPHALFEGFMVTYMDGSASGLPYDLQLFDTVITQVILHDGSSPNDTIIGATVELTTTRNPTGLPGTSFNNGTIKITDGTTTYLSATLSNINFTTDGAQWYLNPGLDINHPETLNLSNILLTPNGSSYIQELATSLGNNTIAGMQITLDVFDGDITSDSYSFIQGLFDGVPVATNTPPVANAGPDVTITTEQVVSTIINGTVTDADAAYTLTCRWKEGTTVLQDWTSVGINGECPLSLGALSLGLGEHTFTMDSNDGEATSTDNMTLTINNTAPNANAGNDITITSEEVAATTIHGAATDFDNGAMLYCKWTEGSTVLLDWTLAGTNGACLLSGLTLARGTHTLTLEATDGQATSSDDMVLTINNTPPLANAGENITVTSDQIFATAIQGSATDFDSDPITCRWSEGAIILQDWTPAGLGGECVLSLSTLSFGLGVHTLTFEAGDGQATASNSMILTVNNSAPHAAPGGSGVYQINTPVTLPGDVSDFDGDLLHYVWADGANALCSGDIQSNAGGTSVLLPDCVVSNLSFGMHTVSLTVSDGFNSPVAKSVTVQIINPIDTTAPILRPVANKYILWPPDHKMVNIAIAANASDNSTCPLTINAAVSSNEPISGLNSGDKSPDWTVPVINQSTGMINLQLRAERSGRGNGRIYTITISATDCSGNVSTAKVKILVPKDQDNDDRKREDREERNRDDRNDKKNCNDRDDDRDH
jgi:hypothetical protein